MWKHLLPRSFIIVTLRTVISAMIDKGQNVEEQLLADLGASES